MKVQISNTSMVWYAIQRTWAFFHLKRFAKAIILSISIHSQGDLQKYVSNLSLKWARKLLTRLWSDLALLHAMSVWPRSRRKNPSGRKRHHWSSSILIRDLPYFHVEAETFRRQRRWLQNRWNSSWKRRLFCRHPKKVRSARPSVKPFGGLSAAMKRRNQ